MPDPHRAAGQLNAMEEALAAARAGEGQLMLLEGSAGMGKTRLAVELQRRAQDRRILVLSGAGLLSDGSRQRGDPQRAREGDLKANVGRQSRFGASMRPAVSAIEV